MSLDQFLLSADTTDLNYPEVRPTLDLNFARVKALDPRITFTRASGGSYVGADGYIKFAGVNEARFDHDPVTGESLGLLIEESRTNLFVWSETFVSGWSWYLGTVLNADTILNPYGVLGTVYYITVNEWTRTFNANGLSTLALSFFAKRRFGGLNKDYNTIEIFQQEVDGGSLGYYNFRFDGNNPNSGQFQNIRTERYQNDWYRFSCTLVARPDYNGGVFASNARVDLEGGGADNYFWGIQVESGAFATSYIPTIGSTRTRAADNASITGKNFSEWYRQDEGTLFCSGIVTVPEKNIAIIKIIDSSLPSSLRGIGFQMDTRTGAKYNSFRTRNTISSPGGNILFPGVNTADAFKKFKGAGSFNLLNNVTLASFDGLNCPPNFTYIENTENILQIGPGGIISGTSGNPFNGTISKFTYYTRALSQSQLQALTR